MNDPLSLVLDTATQGPKPDSNKPRRKILQRIPETDDYILELDYTALSAFLKCQRNFENAHVRGRLGGSVTALSFGGCFHKAEELRLRHGLSPETETAQRELIAKHFVDNPVPTDEYRNGSYMLNLVAAYNRLYAYDGWPAKVLQFNSAPFIERPFKIPLCTISVNTYLAYSKDLLVVGEQDPERSLYVRSVHVLYTGKIDVIIEEPTGIWAPDHKTTSRGGKEYEQAFALSLQTRGYVWAARKLGIPVLGAILNAVINRKITATGKGMEFIRTYYEYSDDVLTDFERSTTATAEEIMNCLTRGFFKQEAQSFMSPCSRCSYSLNCRLPFKDRDLDLASPLFRNNVWDPTDEEEAE